MRVSKQDYCFPEHDRVGPGNGVWMVIYIEGVPVFSPSLSEHLHHLPRGVQLLNEKRCFMKAHKSSCFASNKFLRVLDPSSGGRT